MPYYRSIAVVGGIKRRVEFRVDEWLNFCGGSMLHGFHLWNPYVDIRGELPIFDKISDFYLEMLGKVTKDIFSNMDGSGTHSVMVADREDGLMNDMFDALPDTFCVENFQFRINREVSKFLNANSRNVVIIREIQITSDGGDYDPEDWDDEEDEDVQTVQDEEESTETDSV